jgi:hypothetical protein
MNSPLVIAANTLAHCQIKQWKAVDGPHMTIVNLAIPATLLETELPAENRFIKIHGLTGRHCEKNHRCSVACLASITCGLDEHTSR